MLALLELFWKPLALLVLACVAPGLALIIVVVWAYISLFRSPYPPPFDKL